MSNKLNNNSNETLPNIIKNIVWDNVDFVQTEIASDADNQTLIAEVKLYGVQPGDEILLSSVFSLKNDNDNSALVNFSLWKNDIIIRAFNSSVEANADTMVPFQAIDLPTEAGPAHYTLLAHSFIQNVLLESPITMIATHVRR